MKKTYYIYLILFSALCSHGEPGGTYILTGKEKSIPDIIKADLQAFPDLYADEPLPEYLAAFKSLNQLTDRKLTPGDELIFPETNASRKMKEEAAIAAAEAEALAETARQEEQALLAQQRKEGIEAFEQQFLPYWIRRASGPYDSMPAEILETAKEIIDLEFCEALKFQFHPNLKLCTLTFECPKHTAQYYYAAFREEGGVYILYTLEKGFSMFGTGQTAVFCKWDKKTGHTTIGTRDYTDLENFLAEFKSHAPILPEQ